MTEDDRDCIDRLTGAIKDLSQSVERLGWNDAVGPHGAVEALIMAIKAAAEELPNSIAAGVAAGMEDGGPS